MKTQKNLYQQIIEEVKKRGGETGGEITIRGIISSLISPSATNTSVQAIYEYLGKALKEQIVSGLYTVADSPSSKYIWVKNKGEDSVGVKAGVIYSLSEDTKVEVPLPQPDAPMVLFVNLTTDGRVLIETREKDNELTIAKVNIPYPQSLDVVDDYEKGVMSAYIVTARDLCFRNDFAIDDDTINALRNSMNKLLADNLVGNIKLSEGLKILNQRGTLEVDSEEMRILYLSKVVGARFNKEGTYFYDESGVERARFTADDAQIGNIRITSRTLESVNYETEGFQIKDTGEIDLKESHGYKMMLKPGGIFIRGKMCVVDHPPSGDDYLTNVVVKTIEATPIVISEDKYNFGAKNGQFIKKPSYANNTSSFPDHIYIDYTTNEGTFSNEEHTFTMQDSVVAIITTDSQLDASYVRNLIVGKITNPTGNTYFDLLKGKLNIESSDPDEDNKFVIGDPIGGHGLKFDKSKGELAIRGTFSASGNKIWDSKDDFDGEKHQIDIDSNLGHILLAKDFNEWIETTSTHFNAGVIKDNIDISNNEIKLLRTSEKIDQEQTEMDTYRSSDAGDMGQSFKPSINCILTKVKIKILRIGSPSNLVIYLKADNNNSPGTTLQTKIIPAGNIPTGSYEDIIVDFPDQSVNQDTRYWIYTPESGDFNNHYSWRGKYQSPYTRGDMWCNDVLIWDNDFCFKIYEQHYIIGHFRSQEKDLGKECIFGKFYESHLSGQSYTFKIRRYSGTSWSDWVTVSNGNKINLTNGTKVQYDIVLTSANGFISPKVYDIKIEYATDYHSNGYDRLIWSFGQKIAYTTYSFVADEPTNTNVKIRFRCADTEGGLASADWSAYFDAISGNMTDANIFDSIWIEAEVYLETNDTDYTPDFDKLIVSFMGGLDADKVDGKHANEIDADKVDGKDVPNTIANLLTDHNKAVHDALGINAEQVDGVDIPNTIVNILTDHNANAHPVSVLKFATGSYSEDIPISSDGTRFTTNKYAHQIEVKGESTYIQVIEDERWAVTTSWAAFRYRFHNSKGDGAQYAYAQWSYHSASQQAIWGIWDKDEKELVCVLIEEDEGYCKLYPELKDNQKLIKIKNPKKYEELFAWDIMKLSKEKQIKEEDLEEI